MIRAIMNGCHGVMGHVITDIISKDNAIEIVAGVDMNTETYAGYPVFKSLAECPEADVIIDFSTAKAVDGLLDYCEEKKVPVVLCTTGLSEEQLEKVKEAEKAETKAVSKGGIHGRLEKAKAEIKAKEIKKAPKDKAKNLAEVL